MLQGAKKKRALRDEGSKLPHFESTIGSNSARFSGENRKCDMTTANGRSRDDEATGIAEEYARSSRVPRLEDSASSAGFSYRVRESLYARTHMAIK